MVVGAGQGQPGPAKHGTHPLGNPHSVGLTPAWGAGLPFAHLVVPMVNASFQPWRTERSTPSLYFLLLCPLPAGRAR